MRNLADVIKEYPTPWRVVDETHLPYNGMLYIKDANGEDVDCTGDDPEDALVYAYVEAVNALAAAPPLPMPPPVGAPRSVLVDLLADWMPLYEQWYKAHVRATNEMAWVTDPFDEDRYSFRRARGVIPWQEGQPKPEDIIRRMRDAGGASDFDEDEDIEDEDGRPLF